MDGKTRKPPSKPRTEENEKTALMHALRKKALGYTVTEQTTEYDGEGNEIKNKVSTKEVPPDLAALKLLLEAEADEPQTEEQLEAERDRLLGELAQYRTSDTVRGRARKTASEKEK